MDEIWILAANGGYEGYSEPGDVAFGHDERLFFASEDEALAYLASLPKSEVWHWIEPFRMTRWAPPIPEALPAVHSPHD